MSSIQHIASMRRALIRALEVRPSDTAFAHAAALNRMEALIQSATGCQAGPGLELAKLMFEDLHGIKLGDKPARLASHNKLTVLGLGDRRCLFDPATSAVVTGEPMQAWVASLNIRDLVNVMSAI